MPLARKMWRTLEPVHGFIYFSADAQERYDALGLDQRTGYFASRAAAMGPVPAEVVIATFFNFHPGLVRRSIPDAWERATPRAILQARLDGADAGLRRMLGEGSGGRPAVESPEMVEAAALAVRATEGLTPEGRSLYAAHASLEWPDQPHLRLWHAITLLREFRGDGHIAAMTAEGVGGCEALVIHAATGDVPEGVLRATRAWPDAEWAAAADRLRDRGWLDAEGALTDAGRSHRERVEARTDELAAAPWRHLGEEACARLRELGRPFSQAVVAGGGLSGAAAMAMAESPESG